MNYVIWLSTGLVTLGILLYGLSLFSAFVLKMKKMSAFRQLIAKDPARNIGLPAAALGSFCIVIIFWSLFPPHGNEQGIALRLFGLDFTGPTGPVTLWISCYLAFVLSIKVVSKNEV